MAGEGLSGPAVARAALPVSVLGWMRISSSPDEAFPARQDLTMSGDWSHHPAGSNKPSENRNDSYFDVLHRRPFSPRYEMFLWLCFVSFPGPLISASSTTQPARCAVVAWLGTSYTVHSTFSVTFFSLQTQAFLNLHVSPPGVCWTSQGRQTPSFTNHTLA